MKKIAWTLVELLIALTIMIMLSIFCISAFKPNIQKARYFMYATIANLEKANIAILEKYDHLDEGVDDSNNDNYCKQVADVFNLKSIPNCSRNADVNAVNMVLPNGVTIKGLASAWQAPYDVEEGKVAPYKFKNILVDIDGADGLNSIWADQFPLRIISGLGKGVDGYIMSVNCANDRTYNTDTLETVAVKNSAKSPYCPTNGKNYTIDDQVITYDIYRPESSEENAKARLVATGLSAMEADCAAYGTNDGYFSIEECRAAQIKIHSQCKTKKNCGTCVAGVTCPKDKPNPEDCQNSPGIPIESLICFVVLHKPSGGTSLLIQGLVGDIADL